MMALQGFCDVGIKRQVMKQTVTLLDININVRERNKFVTIVIGVLEQFYPQTELAYIHRLGIDVNPEKTMLDDGSLFMEECFLNAG